ncbi:MAG: hypothetical protein RBT34_15230, partial [Anaerolineaceae bacterium]|nr:hypothetical protein [Anaerolineaceae bacterium]
MKKYSALVFFAFMFILWSCTNLPVQELNHDPLVEKCIPPLVDSFYSTKLPQVKQELILPGAPWSFVANIPEQGIKEKITNRYHKVFMPREGEEVWILTDFLGEDYSDSWLELWIYSPANEVWENRSLAMGIFSPKLTFLKVVDSKNGKIYAIQETTYSGGSVLPNLIAVYDEDKAVFQTIQFTESMP